MDCCESSQPKETDKDVKAGRPGNLNNPAEKEKIHGGGCCGSGTGMWLHLVLMVIVFIAMWYFTGR
ncbi:hypothetical protein ANME2D_02263 [Candidatus Methanoperedens nitroreducens]|uniref:Transmembrane protein n=1 Tax=Candidatus Methanoperedens nitratireducens TaxID=1392998 RepID=A0A062V831_9EURY|nr:hypothetical protein [Candidatus Methanoperedens nitroreducens]KCZ71530.1 hypothetical protein ANME2D_02263 [Candidatus Methanoperedens nitroreducens]MDJ1421159.1 hypothetical protein [Candidatus Methanoperedens sp.]